MQPQVRDAIAYLLTPSVRPRYQARTIEGRFMSEDAACAEIDHSRVQASAERVDAFVSDFVSNSSGAVAAMRVPLIAGCLLLAVVGLTHIIG